MTVSSIKMTARQFLQLGEDPPGVKLELVHGEVAVRPSPIPDHAFAISALTRILGQEIDGHDLGQLFIDVDTIFGEYDVRRPDILYFQKSRLHLIGEKAMEGPPDLAVEVLSPSSVKTDRNLLASLFLEVARCLNQDVGPSRSGRNALEAPRAWAST